MYLFIVSFNFSSYSDALRVLTTNNPQFPNLSVEEQQNQLSSIMDLYVYGENLKDEDPNAFYEETNIMIDQFKNEHRNRKIDFDMFTNSLNSIQDNIEKIESILISLNIKDSSIEIIDKSVLYFAINEMIAGNLDRPVVIDESLRLSKKFSSPESYKFINASLDKYLKTN